MGVIPQLKSLRREDFPNADENFYRLLAILSPFLGDVTSALGGGLDSINLGQQYASLTLTTSATLATTFAPGRVVIKNSLGHAPKSVRLGKCQPKTAPTYAQETWTAIGASDFQNSWTNYGLGYYPAGYRLYNGKVELRGLIKSGTINTTAFVLPVGFRPEFNFGAASYSNSAFGAIQVSSAGLVVPEVGNNANFFLDNFSWEPTPGTWKGVGPFGQPQWSLTSNGTVNINYISGLSPLTDYDITLVIE